MPPRTTATSTAAFTFPSVTAFVDTANGLGYYADKLVYTTGPTAFQANVFNGALFVQDDWKVNKNLTLSGGLRWETQNHIADHSDWAPRVAFAYALDGHKKGTVSKTVLRGGFGLFYDRFSTGNLMNLETLNGTAHSQVQIDITNPTCFSSASLSDALAQPNTNCQSSSSSTPEIYAISPTYRSPYMEQTGVSLERQLTKASTLTLTYMHSSGFHQLVVRDSNAFEPGTYQYGSATLTGTRPDTNATCSANNNCPGIIKQYFPEAVFNENQLIVNINARFSQNLGLFGFYTSSWANSDGGGGSNPSNSYNLMQDYGRAAFVRPQWLFLMGNYTGPWKITFNPFLIAQAGSPYNITSPYDLTGDNFFNDRPSNAGLSALASNVVQTNFGPLDVVPQSGESLVPINTGQRPCGSGRQPAHRPLLRHRSQGGILRPESGRWTSRWWRRWRPRRGRRRLWRRPVWWRRRRPWRTGRWPRRHEQHRPQVLAELQRAGAEPLQRHRPGHAPRRHSAHPQHQHRPLLSCERWFLLSGPRVRQIHQPGRRHLLHQLRRPPRLRPGGIPVLRAGSSQ